MAPTLKSGRSVLVNPRAYLHCPPAPGDVVLLEHPHRPDFLMVKRVNDLQGAQVDVRGDNSDASTDSRDFGLVSLERIRGRVECLFV